VNEENTSKGSATSGVLPLRGKRARRSYGPLLAEAQLKALFDNIVDQPVPADLLDLIRRIDARLPQS
jgi:hypothetical protein